MNRLITHMRLIKISLKHTSGWGCLLVLCVLSDHYSHGQSTSRKQTVSSFEATRESTPGLQITQSFTQPEESVEVASEEAGIVAKIFVKQGQSVNVGDTIAVLDTSVLEATLELARCRASGTAKIDSARSQVELRQFQLEKIRDVQHKGHASESELKRAIAELASAEAELKLAQEQSTENQLRVAEIQAQIARRTIRAPFSGVVTQVHRKVGEYLPLAKPEVATLVRLDALRVRFYLTTIQAQGLSVGQPVNLFLGREQKSVSGIVDFVSPVTDADSATVRVEITLDNSRNQLRSGIECRLAPLSSASDSFRSKTPR